jgi:hypothetical protein
MGKPKDRVTGDDKKGKKSKKEEKKTGKKRNVVHGMARHRANGEELLEKKLARILKSNGFKETAKWATVHDRFMIERKQTGYLAVTILHKMSQDRVNDQDPNEASKIGRLAKMAYDMVG